MQKYHKFVDYLDWGRLYLDSISNDQWGSAEHNMRKAVLLISVIKNKVVLQKAKSWAQFSKLINKKVRIVTHVDSMFDG